MVASLVGVLVAAIALAVVLSRPDKAQAVSAESVSYRPPNSFTPSTATTDRGVERLPTQQRHQYAGSAPELYGGSGNRAVCDVEKQISFLEADRAKAGAFASVVRTTPENLPAYLRGLTSVQLRLDTLVTNHGYENGRAVPYQAVLQAGTAVLIDQYGVPRVRCACGNPLDRPQVERPEKVVGKTWPGFQAEEIVVVVPAPTPVPTFTVIDPATGKRVERPHPAGTSPSPTDTTSPTTTKPPTSPDSPTTTPPPDSPTDKPTDKPTDSPTDEPTTRTPDSPADTPTDQRTGDTGTTRDGGTTPEENPGVRSPDREPPPPNGSPDSQNPDSPPDGGNGSPPGESTPPPPDPEGGNPGSG